ncbi:MAG: hypothetical protein EBV03_07675 [Proteobacteria bacterium]|nr:hypothetical protein [Pseudomonadota bacterium]
MTAKRNVYCLQQTLPDGRQAYYYVQPHPGKEKKFLALLSDKGRGTSFALEDFADIITSGFGEPSRLLKQEMGHLYGIIEC